MKDRSSCIVDSHNCSSEYEEDLMECNNFLDLVGVTKQMENGQVDIYMMAEKLASLLCQMPASSDATSRVEWSDKDGHDHNLLVAGYTSCMDEADSDATSRVEWRDKDGHDHNLLVAGYTSCMDEAIRYMVEEEQYSYEHPVVQGLKHHLVSQQEKVLLETADRGNTTADNKLAIRLGTLCTIRPPSI